jgi:CheY-like chemotaxis protein
MTPTPPTAAATPPGPVILVVEDNEDLRDTLCELLKRQGYQVVQAGQGREALEHLRTAPAPALILLDLMMPVMNGREFRAEQLADPALAAIPTVVLSALDEAQQLRDAEGAARHLRKPVDFNQLLQAVRELTGH